MDDTARLEELKRQHEDCNTRCLALAKEIADIETFLTKKSIESITLSKESKLVDLLIERILSPDHDWKSKIDTLINIPHSLEGADFLRGGDYFEALFQLAIATGILPQFQGVQVKFYDVTGYSKKVEINNYLYTKPVQNSGGGEQGISDITFELNAGAVNQASDKCGEISKPPQTTNPFYFISVKGYKKEGSIAKDYDIPQLKMQSDIFPEIENRHIVVCVRNKDKFMKNLSRSRIEFLKKTINHVIGYDEVMAAFSTFRTNFFLSIESINKDTIKSRVAELFPKTDVYKPSLSLYFHQELVAKSVLNRIKANPFPDKPHLMCVGVLPRGGKSFIAGGIVRYHKRLREKTTGYNVLFLTSAVNETREQFKEDLITKFSDFDDFEFIDVVNPSKTETKPNKFVFVSRQLSSMSKEGEEESLLNEGSFVARLKTVLGKVPSFDICFFDEAHVGIKSEKVREQFQKTFAAFKMPIILMSATYKNPAVALAPGGDDLFVWDLQDVKDMKNLSGMKLDDFLDKNLDVFQRYPLAKEVLNARVSLGETESQIAKPYVNFPNPNFISLSFAPSAIANMFEDKIGYDFLAPFQIKKDTSLDMLQDADSYMKWGDPLTNEHSIRLREFLTPEQESRDEFLANKDRKYRALNQVFKIAQQTNSRPTLGKPFSMIMFLPFGDARLPNIGELCRMWGSFLLNHRYWRDNFVMMTLSTYAKHKPSTKSLEDAIEQGIVHREDIKKPLKDAILTVEQAALKAGKGLVLLTGDVAKMGISLKCVDVVCLLTNSAEPDDIIQKMYRALTDDPPYKKNGYIIDLNVKRVVKAMFDYDIVKSQRTASGKTMKTEERVDRIMELCNWGQDAFIEDNSGKTFDDVMAEIKSRVFAELFAKRKLEYATKDIAEKQFTEFEEADKSAYITLYDSLRLTSFGKKKGKQAAVLMESGTDVPEDKGPGANAAQPASPKPQAKQMGLTPAEFKKKMVDIILTFVNALVIKSDIPWEGMTFQALIDRYTSDKETHTLSCVCEEDGGKSNVYDIAFCELKGFAMKQTGETFEYDEKTHMQIMDFLDKMFQSSVAGTLAPNWTEYIETLISEFTNQKRAV